MYIHETRAEYAFVMYGPGIGRPVAGGITLLAGALFVEGDQTAFGKPLPAIVYLCCAVVIQDNSVLAGCKLG